MIINDQIVKSIHFEEVCTAGEGNLDCSKVVVSLPVFYKYFFSSIFKNIFKENQGLLKDYREVHLDCSKVVVPLPVGVDQVVSKRPATQENV